MSKLKLWMIVIGAVLIVAVVAATAIRSRSVPAAEVKTAVAETREYEDKVLATGKVEAVKPMELLAPFAAKLLSLDVREGDPVTAGQPLGKLDMIEIENRVKEAETALVIAETELDQTKATWPDQLAEAESALKASEAQAETARLTWERYRFLLEQGAVSQSEYEDVETAHLRAQADARSAAARLETLRQGNTGTVKVQQARVRQAQIALETARDLLTKGQLRAPAAGMVLQTGAKEGSFVQPGALIATIGNPGSLEVLADVSEQDISGIAAGQDAEIQWAGAPDRIFKGKVSRVAPAVTKGGSREAENVIRVYIELKPGYSGLKPGATVDAVIYRVKPRKALLVPNEAVTGTGTNKTVYVVKDKKARKRAVTVGYSNELFTEIRSGVEAGETVILNPKDLKDGQPVRSAGGGQK